MEYERKFSFPWISYKSQYSCRMVQISLVHPRRKNLIQRGNSLKAMSLRLKWLSPTPSVFLQSSRGAGGACYLPFPQNISHNYHSRAAIVKTCYFNYFGWDLHVMCLFDILYCLKHLPSNTAMYASSCSVIGSLACV